MEPLSQRRAIRQLLQTDMYFGLDAMPIGPAGNRTAADLPALESAPPLPTPKVLSPREKAQALAALEQEHNSQCPHCSPQRERLKMVFGEGDPNAQLVFIGEGPGEEENRQGRPFVGRSGQLLDKQIQAMGLKREAVYIANIVKCRPPDNRVPTPQEAALCMPYLERQIQIIQPRAIVSLGATAAKYLLAEPNLAITRQRGQWRTYQGIDLMPTFHPAYLLRAYTEENRRNVWSDLQQVIERLKAPSS